LEFFFSRENQIQKEFCCFLKEKFAKFLYQKNLVEIKENPWIRDFIGLRRLLLCIILLFIYQVLLLLLFAKKEAKETIGICFFFLFEEKVVDVFVSGWSTSFSLVVAPAGATVCCASA